MAKYISIPTTVADIPFNTDLITSVVWTGTTTFIIWSYGKSFTFTTSAAGAAGAVASVYKAMLHTAGPLLVPVVLPSGVTIAAGPVNN